MKLFWQKYPKEMNKVVRIEITNTTLPIDLSVGPAVEKLELKTPDYGLAIKLAAIIGVTLNSLLAVMGYVDFTGKLETLGISTNEIDLSVPTLLFQGYIKLVLDPFSSAARLFPWGAIALTFVPTIIFYFPISKLVKKRSGTDKLMLAMIMTLFAISILIIPTAGWKKGIESAFTTFEKQNDMHKQEIRDLDTEVSIKTNDDKIISGYTVFASTLYTYVLQGAELFKIANRDNHIVSVTKITPKFQDKPVEASQ